MDVVEDVDGDLRAEEPSDASNLLHRWFVQYNPLYLASAACVLVGVYLVSDGLGGAEARSNELWLTPVVQLYEVLLIAGAAFLYRVVRQRRPAVILAIVEVVYLCDVTFQTEVAAYLGTAGVTVSVVWAVALPLKLVALAWGLRLRLSVSAMVLPALGALLVAAMPHLLYQRLLSPKTATMLIACGVFGLVAAGFVLKPRIASRDRLSAWGLTVLRRARKAVWVLWAGFLVGHVVFWFYAHELGPVVLLLCSAILLTVLLRGRDEGAVWLGAGIALGLSLFQPQAVSCTALLAALMLALRGRRGWQMACPQPEVAQHPYRQVPGPADPPSISTRANPCPRLYVGAVACLYAAAWTAGWQGWPLPSHNLWLDLATTALLVALLVRWRLYSALLPVVGINLHLALERRMVPSGKLQWGALLVLGGFVLLVGGVVINWALSRRVGPSNSAVDSPRG